MRAPSEARWSYTLARYLTAHGIPVRWNETHKVFTGLKGVSIKRVNPRSIDSPLWARLPDQFNRFERDARGRPLVLIVTNKVYGNGVEDSFVVVRLGTAASWLSKLISVDRERWLGDAP